MAFSWGMFAKAKDWASSRTAQEWLRGRIARYAELKELAIDSRNKTVDVVLCPHGEHRDVKVRIEKYEVITRGETRLVRVLASSSSHTWVANLMADFLEGRTIEVPRFAAALL
jgi:hypothetical protein